MPKKGHTAGRKIIKTETVNVIQKGSKMKGCNLDYTTSSSTTTTLLRELKLE